LQSLLGLNTSQIQVKHCCRANQFSVSDEGLHGAGEPHSVHNVYRADINMDKALVATSRKDSSQ